MRPKALRPPAQNQRPEAGWGFQMVGRGEEAQATRGGG